jgi:glycosyltransferase involved in cell wall biosynthesis
MVPALNEERRLRKTVLDIISAAKKAGRSPLDIIIVNDGSTDGTARVIEGLQREFRFIQAIHNERNIGVGRGVRKAIKLAKYDRFLLVAGDNDMPQKLMIKLFKSHDQADLVMSFFLNKENRGFFRNFLSTVFGFIYMTVFRIHVQYVSGPVVYPTAKVRELKLHSRRFSIAPEITTKLLLRGCSFCEIAGYMQTGQEGSSALRIKNLAEVVKTFLLMFLEIKILDREFYRGRPRRVFL